MIGKTISHYRIQEKLGQGGMGVVYRAEDTKLRRAVALKFLPTHLAAHGEERDRFLLEAQAASSLNHPNICTIYQIDEVNGETFIAMELVEGSTLREWIQRKAGEAEGYRKLALRDAIGIALQIADGLQAAHDKQIVHRDVKSENVMVTPDGRAKVMDFGLAKLHGVSKLTKAGSTIGTMAYMSPEQVEGLETDHRTDIFSFGVLLFELFTGRLPFQAVHEAALMYEIINTEPPALGSVRQSIDEEINRIVMTCLEKDRETRYQSMREVAADLRRYRRDSEGRKLDRGAVGSAAQSAGARSPAGGARLRLPVIGAVLAGAAIIAAIALYSSLRPSASVS
jgi:serine/threonine protein kinase